MNRAKHLFIPDNIQRDIKLYQYAEDLFKTKGFCVIKNIFKTEDINYLKQLCISNKYSLVEPDTLTKYIYFYKNKDKNKDKKVEEIGIKIHKIRNSILLQSNSDQHLRSYCWRYALNPFNEDKLVDHQLNHSYMRLNQQKKGGHLNYHYDSPGEIQSILFLSQFGEDYEAGGLVCIGYDDKEYEIDKNVNIGDLVLVNAYYCKHTVKKIICSSKQLGRLTFFVPIISDSHPMFEKAYYFKENIFKLYFKTPNEFHDYPGTKLIKIFVIIYLYIVHFIKILFRKKTPIDYHHLN
tara:strand:- start:7558 stop:8436 length:879 start_codon:yes stop_codon:yes gene_type:complete